MLSLLFPLLLASAAASAAAAAAAAAAELVRVTPRPLAERLSSPPNAPLRQQSPQRRHLSAQLVALGLCLRASLRPSLRRRVFHLRSRSRFELRAGTWALSAARLKWGRHYNAAAFGPDGCLYVSGAYRHSGQLDVVERYDPRKGGWETLPGIGVAVNFSAGAFTF